MSAAVAIDSASALRTARAPRRGLVTWLTLAAVAITFAASGFVFSEPAPVDALTIGLIVLLPTVGLVSFTPGVLAYGAMWLVAAACLLLAGCGQGGEEGGCEGAMRAHGASVAVAEARVRGGRVAPAGARARAPPRP